MPLIDVLVIIGPSGSGKSSVAQELHRRGLVDICPTWTTRPMRPGEGKGSLEHRFVSDAQFDRLNERGFFRVTGGHVGLPHRYGLAHLSRTCVRTSVVILRAGHVVRVMTPGDAALVYQLAAPSWTVAARLRMRGDPPQEIETRLAAHHDEVRLGRDISSRHFRTDRPVPMVADDVAAALFQDRRSNRCQPGGSA
jgi:guanylate kinase